MALALFWLDTLLCMAIKLKDKVVCLLIYK